MRDNCLSSASSLSLQMGGGGGIGQEAATGFCLVRFSLGCRYVGIVSRKGLCRKEEYHQSCYTQIIYTLVQRRSVGAAWWSTEPRAS